jgi:hypothetical protein
MEKAGWAIPAARSTALAPIAPVLHLCFHVLAMMDFCGQQDHHVANAGQAGHAAAFVDPTGHVLGAPLALPDELNGEWPVTHDRRFLCL